MAELSLKSKDDYKYIEPTFEIKGVGMGENGDYRLLRGEDVSFAAESMEEIDAIEKVVDAAKKGNFDITPSPNATRVARAKYRVPTTSWQNCIVYCNIYRSPFREDSLTAPSNYNETTKSILELPLAVDPKVANIPVAVFGESGLPTFTRSINYKGGGGEESPDRVSQSILLRPELIQAFYKDLASNDGIYIELWNRYSRAQAYSVLRDNKLHRVYYTKTDPPVDPTIEDITETDPLEYTGVTGSIDYLSEHYATWKKEHIVRLSSDGSTQNKYTNTTFDIIKKSFKPNDEQDMYVEIPTSTGATDIEIVDAKWYFCLRVERSSSTSLGLELHYDKNYELVSRKEATNTNNTQAKFIVVPATVTKAEKVDDRRIRYTFDPKSTTLVTYLDEFKTMAHEYAGMVSYDMNQKAQAAYDASTAYPTLGADEGVTWISDSGIERFEGRIFRVVGYLKLKRHTRVVDGETSETSETSETTET